jgi:hypothetical protein
VNEELVTRFIQVYEEQEAAYNQNNVGTPAFIIAYANLDALDRVVPLLLTDEEYDAFRDSV